MHPFIKIVKPKPKRELPAEASANVIQLQGLVSGRNRAAAKLRKIAELAESGDPAALTRIAELAGQAIKDLG